MAENIPRLPLAFERDPNIRIWLAKVLRRLYTAGVFPWSVIDKSGSNLTDIETRNHNDLQSIDGGATGEYYHLTENEHTVGSLESPVVTKTDDYTMTVSDNHILCDTSSNDIEITLPASQADGKVRRITKLEFSNRVTITPDGTETINGNDDAVMFTKGSSFALQAITGGWRVF